MKKILIIGSNSFAGSDFIDFLLSKNLLFMEYQEEKKLIKKI
jgi:hypothetical protein